MSRVCKSSPSACFRCGTVFPFGGLRYRIDIRVAADTGSEVTIADLEGELERLKGIIEGKSPEELEDEVHKDFCFYLCSPCKDEYMKGPQTPLDAFFFGE